MDDIRLYGRALSAAEIATLAVRPNTPPSLDPIGDQTVDELTELTFTATASDPDAGDTLTFSLADGAAGAVPAGAAITPTGAFSWTPTEDQDGTHTFDVVVSDGTDTDRETITVTVNEVTTPGPTHLFADDFESGTLDAWVNHRLVVQQQEVASGAWAARATPAKRPAWASHTFVQTQSDVTFEARVKLIAQSGKQVNLMRFNNRSGDSRLRLYLTPKGALALRQGSGPAIVSSTFLTPGAWHTLKLRLLIGNPGESEVWLDGVRVERLSVTRNFGTAVIAGIAIGEWNSGRRSDVAYDDVVVDVPQLP
jgi:hypothetical protein